MLNFMPRFVEPIQSGRKRHTIRADRIIQIKLGDKLYLYCGARHPGAFRILPDPQPCIRVERIHICETIVGVHVVTVNGQELARDECERLAYCDGFNDFAHMMKFWTGRLPFNGNIIHWR